MDLLDLAKEVGLSPLKAAQTSGGEYICACPKCGAYKGRAVLDIKEAAK